jgi:hypothetical protein
VWSLAGWKDFSHHKGHKGLHEEHKGLLWLYNKQFLVPLVLSFVSFVVKPKYERFTENLSGLPLLNYH